MWNFLESSQSLSVLNCLGGPRSPLKLNYSLVFFVLTFALNLIVLTFANIPLYRDCFQMRKFD